MIYTTDDIDFSKVSPNEFERLCFELILKYGFNQLIWRQGGADNGRDIEGYYDFNNPIKNQRAKWFFECKHYTSGGVPPEHLNSKMAWADAEQPSFLVILVSSYITTPARFWLESIRSTKQYQIVVIEGEELKGRLVQFSDLIERFFADNRYEQLFLQMKSQWLRHRIEPSYELIKEISNNIDISKLDLGDVGFLLISFHKNYHHFESRNDYYGDFTDEVLEPLYPRLIQLASTKELHSFEEYSNDFDYLGGIGCFDDAEIEEQSNYAFQFYELHLNHKKSRDLWKIGYYLFIKDNDGHAFEIFSTEDSDFETSAKFYEKFTGDLLKSLSIGITPDFGVKIMEFSPRLSK
ncbi:restriction endonuclease [Flagellimonas marinaquae]|nr:restriction endonuclease [Allomuricauda aquimarina]